MKRYCSSENYFSLKEINLMMYTGNILLQFDLVGDGKFRLQVYLKKDWSIPPDGYPNSISLYLGCTRVLSRLPIKRFSLVRKELLSNDYFRRYLGGVE